MTTDLPPTRPRFGLQEIAARGIRELMFEPPQEIVPGTLSHLHIPFADVPGYRFLRLDLHVPKQTTTSVPVVVYASGGGFRANFTHAGPWRCLLGEGYAVAVVEYRLGGEVRHPGQMHDIKGAIRWLRANAETYGLDAARVAGWGSSAGGYLISMVAITANALEFEGDVGGNLECSSALAAVIDHYAPTDFTHIAADTPDPVEPLSTNDSFDTLYLGYVPTGRPAEAAAAALTTHVTPDTAPFLILHGDADTRVGIEQSRRLYTALRACDVDATLHVVPDVDHVAPEFEQVEANALAIAFLDRHLRPRQTA